MRRYRSTFETERETKGRDEGRRRGLLLKTPRLHSLVNHTTPGIYRSGCRASQSMFRAVFRQAYRGVLFLGLAPHRLSVGLSGMLSRIDSHSSFSAVNGML